MALREATEETGLPREHLLPHRGRVPLDLDIHAIPARNTEPAHLHYDLRYLLIAPPTFPLTPETPGLRLAWFELAQVPEMTQEESVLRMVRKLGLLPREPDGRLQPG